MKKSGGMIKFIRDLRLIPIAVIACICLLALKAADLALGGSTMIAGNDAPRIDTGTSIIRATPDVARPAPSMLSWASQMFNFPDGSGATTPAQLPVVAARRTDRGNLDITGSVPEPAKGAPQAKSETKSETKPDAKPEAKADPAKPKQQPPGTVIPLDGAGQISGAERAILERLQERRQELDARARELDIRESLIKAAETRIDGKLAEVKETESRIAVETKQQDDAQAARFKGLVTMYENMKPRDAAKIFDRLDPPVLLEVASKIEPRHMADIMAQMSPDAAQHLTVELASQAQQIKPVAGGPNDLPKIQGQPTQ
jgi:flagellar motility protein MotE (MotC chaperone)